MAFKNNPLNPIMSTLLDRMSELTALAWATETQFIQRESDFLKLLNHLQDEATRSGDANLARAGQINMLSVPNIMTKEPLRISYKSTAIYNKAMQDLISESNSRFQAQCICWTYEAFESFIRFAATEILYASRRSHTPKRRSAFHKQNKKWAKSSNTGHKDYYQAYVKFTTAHNYINQLDELKAILPDLDKQMASNWLGDLNDRLKTMDFIRHRTVHCGGELPDDPWTKLPPAARPRVRSRCRLGLISGRLTILPQANDVDWFIDGVSAAAYALHTYASRAFNWEPDLFKEIPSLPPS